MSDRPSIAVVGGMNIDIQGKSFQPFKAGDSNPGSFSLIPGGVGRNIAENLVLLGARVELVSVLGDDAYSSILADSCVSAGIGLGGTLRLEHSSASQYLCLLDCDGSLAGAVAAMEAMDRLTPERLQEAASLLDSADLIIVDANVPESSINWIAERYPRGKKRPLLGFDPVSARKAGRGIASLGAFDFAKPNRAEASILARVEGRLEPGALAGDLAGALRARGLGEAFISLGTEGLWAEGQGSDALPERWAARLPAQPKPGFDAVNLSGAGDAACAAIAWGLLCGKDLGERCALALAAATIAAASETAVNPAMSADLLLEAAKGIDRERIS